MEIGSAVECDTEVVDVDEVVHDGQTLVARDRVEKLGRWFSSTRGLVATHAQDIADGDTYGIRKCGGITSHALGSHAHAFEKIGRGRLAAHMAC